MSSAQAKAVAKLPSDWLIYEEMSRFVFAVTVEQLCFYGSFVPITTICCLKILLSFFYFCFVGLSNIFYIKRKRPFAAPSVYPDL